jgi:hypothetical protein
MDTIASVAVRNEVHWRFSKHEIAHGVAAHFGGESRLRRICIAFLHESATLLCM